MGKTIEELDRENCDYCGARPQDPHLPNCMNKLWDEKYPNGVVA